VGAEELAGMTAASCYPSDVTDEEWALIGPLLVLPIGQRLGMLEPYWPHLSTLASIQFMLRKLCRKV